MFNSKMLQALGFQPVSTFADPSTDIFDDRDQVSCLKQIAFPYGGCSRCTYIVYENGQPFIEFTDFDEHTEDDLEIGRTLKHRFDGTKAAFMLLANKADGVFAQILDTDPTIPDNIKHFELSVKVPFAYFAQFDTPAAFLAFCEQGDFK